MTNVVYDRYKKGCNIMNNVRRKEINKAIKTLEDVKSYIENIYGDEESYINNIPDNLQGSSRYSDAEEAASYLEDAIDNLNEAIENLESASL